MKEKKFIETVNRLGGKINYPSCIVDFPKCRIKTKKDALDMMDVLRNANSLDGCERQYTVNLDEALDAIKAAIKKMSDGMKKERQEGKHGNKQEA